MKHEPTRYSVKHLKVIPEFFERAHEMRSIFNVRFASPRTFSRDRFVWDYWHVPDQYTYIRTIAQYYFPRELFNSFLRRLCAWGEANLGCDRVTQPWLSYYVDGCRQELHTDIAQGPWAYVFSLTHWNTCKFRGGETILLRPSCLNFWRDYPIGESAELMSLIEKIPPLFNQLVVFDPRIPHGVHSVEGSRDPLDSRLVLHGWFMEPTLQGRGTIDLEQSRSILDAQLAQLAVILEGLGSVAGLLITRINLNLDGSVKSLNILTDTLVSSSGDTTAPKRALQQITALLYSLKFPPVRNKSWLDVPIRLPR
jgi:2OG-Fe(II) oxygenase superfamily